jgi:hypothetical protein
MSSKDLIDLQAKQNEEYLAYTHKAMPGPEVGTWWIIDGEVQGDTKDLNEADFDVRNKIKYNRTLHAIFWPKLLKFLKHIPAHTDYRAYTRGRVYFRVEDKVFEIWGNETLLKDSVAVQKIKDFHNIPSSAKVELKPDAHYEV